MSSKNFVAGCASDSDGGDKKKSWGAKNKIGYANQLEKTNIS